MIEHQKTRQALIDDCAAYCAREGITEQTFGQKFLKDRKFLERLRNGGWCRPETEEKVRRALSATPRQPAS